MNARVRTRNGVPQLVIDGRPVRPRIFWGGANAAPVAVGTPPRTIAFSFEAPLDTDTATLHLRFGQSPGRVALRDLRVVEEGTGRDVVAPGSLGAGFGDAFRIWPPPEKNTVGRVAAEGDAVRVTIQAPPGGGEWPDFHLYHDARLTLRKGRRYRVSLRADADPGRGLTIALYQPGTTYTFLAGPSETYDRQVRLAAAAGVDLVSFEMPLPWPEPGQSPDWRAVDAVCARTLAANPRALLLPRIGLYPPPGWLAAHPDAVMRWDDGDHGGAIATAASETYRRDAAARLDALIRHVEARWGERVVGYHPTGQNTGEWFWMDSWTGALPGYAPDDRRAWDAWRRANGLPDAPVPSPAQRRAPTPSDDVVAFHRFLSETMADCVVALAGTVRRATRGRKLSVWFYGYGFEFAPMPSGPANAGHHALRRVLDSPDVDIVCAPFSYYDRAFGQSGPVMACAESVALAGKLWLNEDDTRTHKAVERTLPGWDSGADDAAKASAILARNLAQCVLRHQACWWMDLPGTGWFDDPALWETMRRFARIDRDLTRNPVPFRPDVALILDETVAYRLPPAAPKNAGLSLLRGALGRMGTPYGQYLADDAVAGRCPAKLWVVACADSLTPRSRAALERAARGRTVLWADGPGSGVTPGSLRALARKAGARLWTDTDAAVFALGGIVAVAAVADGPVRVAVGGTGTVRDAGTGKALGRGPVLTLALRKGDVRVLDLRKGAWG